MADPDQRMYYIITTRGERGPVSHAELHELLHDQAVQGTDQVRNAFGRVLGAVTDVLATSPGATGTARITATAPPIRRPGIPQRPQPSSRMHPGLLIGMIVGGCAVIAILVGYCASSSVSQSPSPPLPSSPASLSGDSPAARTSGPEPTDLAQTVAPPPPRPQHTGPDVVPARQPEPRPQAPLPTDGVSSTPALAAPASSVAGWQFHEVDGARGMPPIFTGTTWEVGVISRNLWGSRDQCRLLAHPLTGDGEVTTGIDFTDATRVNAMGGVTMRLTLEPQSPQVSLVSSPGGKISLIIRRLAAADSESLFQETRPATLLRLRRQGTTITGAIADQAQTWREIGRINTPALTGPIVAGLILCGDFQLKPITAKFSRMSLTATTP